ncbi:E3 ubiquitin-protein ligase RNF182-like [Phasianus colchicus]|uniref:E3 ubiquitin-protein ligase RNF182 n=1 Tax=Phasianus colchicus TaxID=9054 RepID=A0A669NZF4_PHACC|nr:E3 ubiquitin-protein ligase RNF182-like [Phasianus colchicus]
MPAVPAAVPARSASLASLWDGPPPAACPPGAPAGPVPMAHEDEARGGRQLAAQEPECQICYSRYDARARRPTVLLCGHRLCARCLRRMVALGDASPRRLRCPFCRRQSPVPGGDAQRPQDDGEGPAPPTRCERDPPSPPEVLLSPSVLQPSPGPDCLVLTILEVPAGAVPTEALGALEVVRLQSRRKSRARRCRAAPRCLLGTLCLLYCSSLPLGIYLLLSQHHGLGLALVSLLPAALLLCVSCSLCQCLCRELCAFPSP